MMNPKPDDIIIIKINGKEIETIIDENGTQRLPANPILVLLFHSHPWIDYNLLAKLTSAKVFSQNDQRFIYQNNGYSVDGYTEIFPNDVIENPLWENENDRE